MWINIIFKQLQLGQNGACRAKGDVEADQQEFYLSWNNRDLDVMVGLGVIVLNQGDRVLGWGQAGLLIEAVFHFNLANVCSKPLYPCKRYYVLELSYD